MTKPDEALTLSNPRLLSAVYFGLLSIIFTFILHTFLATTLGIKQLLPIFQAILLAVGVSSIFGALFGERIVHCQKPYLRHAFYWGCLMTLLALPIYDIGFVYLYSYNHPALLAQASWSQMVMLYLFIVLDSFILIGLWLMLLTGLAAMYLRGVLVYYFLRALND